MENGTRKSHMEDIKDRLWEILEGIDIERLSLYDLSTYLDICKKMKEIEEKSYSEIMSSIASNGFGSSVPKTPIIKDLKGV